jgi:hypothetical protein
MIPLGILNQDSRDLSKEIWISWGYGYDQEQGVFVNAISSQPSYSTALKNAAGEDTPFSFNYDAIPDIESWHNSTTAGSTWTTLPIVNARSGIVYSDYDIEHLLYNISCATSGIPLEMYILPNRSSNITRMTSVSGWGGSGWVIAQGTELMTMEITEDFYKVENTLTTGIGVFSFTPQNAGQNSGVSAIVIKLLT